MQCSLNLAELVQLAETVPSLLPPVTKNDVGELGICMLDWKKKGGIAADLGRIEHYGVTKLGGDFLHLYRVEVFHSLAHVSFVVQVVPE